MPFSADLYGGSNKSKKTTDEEELEIRKIRGLVAGMGIELSDAHDSIKDILRGKYAGGDANRAFEYAQFPGVYLSYANGLYELRVFLSD